MASVVVDMADDDSSYSNPVNAVLFVGISLVLGVASRHLLRGTRVPYTAALLVIGIAIGSLGLFYIHSSFIYSIGFSKFCIIGPVLVLSISTVSI